MAANIKFSVVQITPQGPNVHKKLLHMEMDSLYFYLNKCHLTRQTHATLLHFAALCFRRRYK